jgi:type IX secretion system PorP/SprF family membrane protein
MKTLIIGIFILFFSSKALAQQDEQMSMYMQNPLYFNPAYAGSRDALSIVSMARFQWINYKGAPQTQWLSAHAPLLNKALGVGIHALNDAIGSRNRTAIYGDVNASIPLNAKNNRLAIGLSGGVDLLSYDFNNLTVTDINDPFYGQKLTTTKPNVGAGAYWYSDKHYVGLSAPRVLESKIKDANQVLKTLNKRHFFLAAGYVFKLNSVLKLKPSMLMKYTPNAPIVMDANMSLLMHEKLWVGIMYRLNESFGVNAMFTINNKLTIGYAYDFPTNGLRKYQSGSHEFCLQYDIRRKNTAFTSPRYF